MKPDKKYRLCCCFHIICFIYKKSVQVLWQIPSIERVFLFCANFTPYLHLLNSNDSVCLYSLLNFMLIYHNFQKSLENTSSCNFQKFSRNDEVTTA